MMTIMPMVIITFIMMIKNKKVNPGNRWKEDETKDRPSGRTISPNALQLLVVAQKLI